jgi:hypothetical protein
VTSDHAYVLGFFALFARRSVELDALTFFEALIAVTLDTREMYKDVITLLARDEAESLFCIEKLHCSLCHEYSILNAADRPFPPARFKGPYSSWSNTRTIRETRDIDACNRWSFLQKSLAVIPGC